MLAAQAALAVLVAEGFRRLDLTRRRLAAAGEMVALGLVVLIGFAVVETAEVALASILLAISVWLLGVVTAADLEAVAAPTDLVEGIRGPSARLHGRYFWVGVALGLIAAASFGVGCPPASADPKQRRRTPAVAGLLAGGTGVAGNDQPRPHAFPLAARRRTSEPGPRPALEASRSRWGCGPGRSGVGLVVARLRLAYRWSLAGGTPGRRDHRPVSTVYRCRT